MAKCPAVAIATALVATSLGEGCFIAIDPVRGDAVGGAGGVSPAGGMGGEATGGEAAGGEAMGGSGAGGAGAGGGAVVDTCKNVDFMGTCIGNVSFFWWDERDTSPPLPTGEPAGCWVRDCVSEGLTCHDLGDGGNAGYGCGPGTYTEQPCQEIGPAGLCSQDGDTAVWWDAVAGVCRWAHCPESGTTCGFDAELGRNACM